MPIQAWVIAFLLTGLMYLLAGWLAFRYLGGRALTSSLISLHLASPVILEKIRDGVVLLDVQDQILHVNSAALRILEQEPSFTGQPLETLFQSNSATALQLMKARAGRWDLQEKTPSGDKWLDMTFSPLTDKKGKHRGQIVIFRDITPRKLAQIQLEAANLELNARNRDLDRYNCEIRTLHEMSNQLQACAMVEESYPIIRSYMEQLLPAVAGGLYVCSPQRRCLELVLSWPDQVDLADQFEGRQCKGLVQGELYRSGSGWADESCGHVAGQEGITYTCRPLIIEGVSMGLLHIFYPTAQLSQNQFEMALAVLDTIKLGLLNLMMQDKLRQESIRDPLTNLFNRRYMEEALRMALYHAQRTGQPLALVMADVDNFKQINDRYGHQQGDKVLVQVGQLFLNNIRRNDIACRYGGDEFILVMPDAPLQSAYARADALRRELSGSPESQSGPEPISLSLGVAAFPEHGETAAGLIGAADKALYLAKQGGRDRIHSA